MISTLLTERYLFGNAVLDLFYPLLSPNNEQLPLKFAAEGAVAGPVFWALRMSIAFYIIFTLFGLFLITALHIPLPDGISDRLKLQFIEFVLRLSNEYVGDLVEVLFGPKVRNKFTRFVVSIAFLFQQGPPKGVTLKVEDWDGVPVRVYLPEKRKSNAALVFIHGGGWAIMKAKYYDGSMYRMIARLGIAVFSVDYRLAPEHPYPAGADDCENAIKMLYFKKFEEYGIDRERIALAGDSAGGNLTAVICQRFLKQKLNIIKAQVLLYPVVQPFDYKSPSHQRYYNEYKGSALLNPVQMARWYLLYLGLPAGRKDVDMIIRNQHISEELSSSRKFRNIIDRNNLPKAFLDDMSDDFGKEIEEPTDPAFAAAFSRLAVNPDVSPLFGEELEGLPPALVVTAGYDILRDEGAMYVRRLQTFKVPVEWNHYPAAFHGVFNMPLSGQRRQIKNDIAAFLERVL